MLASIDQSMDAGAADVDAAPIRPMAKPRAHAEAEREEHGSGGHAVFRSWCRACCVGRGRMQPDCGAVGRRGSFAPVIAIDCAYFNDRDADGEAAGDSPVLVLRSSCDRWLAGHVVPSKGADAIAIDAPVNEIVVCGAPEVIIASDQELAIKALKDAACNKARLRGVAARTEESAAHDSRENVKDQVRTLLVAPGEKYGEELNGAHPVTARAVRRREATQRCDQEFLDKFTAAPWDRRGARPAAARLAPPTAPEASTARGGDGASALRGGEGAGLGGKREHEASSSSAGSSAPGGAAGSPAHREGRGSPERKMEPSRRRRLPPDEEMAPVVEEDLAEAVDAAAMGVDAVAVAAAYSKAGVKERAWAFRLAAGAALCTRAGWGLAKEEGQRKAKEALATEQPYLLPLGPMRAAPTAPKLIERLEGNAYELTVRAVELGPTLGEPSLLESAPVDEEAQVFRDRCTGLPLDPAMVAQAREEGRKHMGELGVMKVAQVLVQMGYKLGRFSPCVACQAGVVAVSGAIAKTVRMTRHGDDFGVSGKRSLTDSFKDELGRHLLVKHRGTLGPNKEMGDVSEITHLNRILRWYAPGDVGGERIELEADPRHVELLIWPAGLDAAESKPVTTPGVKAPAGVDDGPVLDASRRSAYRSMGMRAAYLSQDRAELQFSCKELARRMQQPCLQDERDLKRMVRFLLGAPRCVTEFRRQDMPRTLDVFSDFDWAGCVRTRRSSSSSYMMHGSHLLCSSSTTQNVIATSSGKAEF
ncbi:unnamed protein product [Prorocentrum cordatum]|uniref:DNA-directed RNA polymerase n=1 Tax=Prorocentrum cordatum TaxID=2364126 RepID=A0ABN9QYC1_9DINO|nr:unnamed protein product [Polarella glacialis]